MAYFFKSKKYKGKELDVVGKPAIGGAASLFVGGVVGAIFDFFFIGSEED